MKDGSIKKGKILKENAKRIVFKDAEGEKRKIPQKNILRVIYLELSLKKVYVQRKDGKNFTGFIVNEDRESYTFRKKLNTTKEFRVMRSDVMFVTERNPSGLKGKAAFSSIFLKWYPSFEKMDHYRIYLKVEGGTYRAAAESETASYTLKNLKSNTKYRVKVTGIDKDKIETSPSNELNITTKSFPPSCPGDFDYVRKPGGALVFNWKASMDRDGKVTKYQVYGVTKEGKELPLKETTEVSYTLKDSDKYDTLMVRAVDDRRDMSEFASSTIWDGNSVIGLSAGAIIPLGDFGEMSVPGYGGSASFTRMNLFLEGLDSGMHLGGYYLSGKDALYERSQKYERFLLARAFLQIRYAVFHAGDFSLLLAVSGGAVWIQGKYINMDWNNNQEIEETKQFFEPAVTGGLDLEYYITDTNCITLYGEIIYDGNGANIGEVPVDATQYKYDEEAVISGKGNLGKMDGIFELSFLSWNTEADGSGTSYNPGDTVTPHKARMNLYACWSSVRSKIDDPFEDGTSFPGLSFITTAFMRASTIRGMPL